MGTAFLFLATITFYLQYYVADNTTAVHHAGLVASVATVIMFGSPLASLVSIIILGVSGFCVLRNVETNVVAQFRTHR